MVRPPLMTPYFNQKPSPSNPIQIHLLDPFDLFHTLFWPGLLRGFAPPPTRNVHFRRAAGEQDTANAQEEDQDTQGLSAVALHVEGFFEGLTSQFRVGMWLRYITLFH